MEAISHPVELFRRKTKTYNAAPPTLPICTMAEMLPLTLAKSPSFNKSKPNWCANWLLANVPEINPSSTPTRQTFFEQIYRIDHQVMNFLPLAAPMMPKEKTANHSRQLNASGGSTPRLILKMFCGFPPPPAMLVMMELI